MLLVSKDLKLKNSCIFRNFPKKETIENKLYWNWKKHSQCQSILPCGNKDMKVKKCQLTFPSQRL